MTTSQDTKGNPPIHLWVYNHPIYGIGDQIDYFLRAFRQHGYSVSIGHEPVETALNVVIENLSMQTRNTLIDFCARTKKRVAMVMTEHIDFVDSQILIHGDPLWSDNDYMHPATQVERLKYLMSCQPYIKFFMVLGDLPELRNFSSLMIGAEVCAIPFPKLEYVDVKARTVAPPKSDLLFTGFATEYRERIVAEIKAIGPSILSPQKFVSRKHRDLLNRSARIVLNIPQRKNWRWLSLMRIIAALRCGRATVSLGTSDTSRIAACTYQLNLEKASWKDELKEYVAHWTTTYDKMYDAYCKLVNEFEQEHPFPHDVMEYWAITDNVGCETF
jgi:hypothetical protein